MAWWVPLLILGAGVLIAARITSWVNWFTYGQNRERRLRELREKEAAHKPDEP